jgi:Arc/MetJ-type ribon-helix-helix transcriptional regulator
MHRIQIQLTDEQERMLRDMARLRRASISALVREGVEQLIAPERERREERRQRMLAFIGSMGSDEGATDVSERHDDYLADILYEDIVRGRE